MQDPTQPIQPPAPTPQPVPNPQAMPTAAPMPQATPTPAPQPIAPPPPAPMPAPQPIPEPVAPPQPAPIPVAEPIAPPLAPPPVAPPTNPAPTPLQTVASSMPQVATAPSPIQATMPQAAPAPAMASVAAAPANTFNNTYYGASGNELGINTRKKPKVGLIIGIAIAAVTLVAAGIITWLQWDNIAIIFDPKFSYYSLDQGKYGKFQVKYYKGSVAKLPSDIEAFNESSSSSEKDIKFLVQPGSLSELPLLVGIGKASGSKKLADQTYCKSDSTSIILKQTGKAGTLCPLLKYDGRVFAYGYEFDYKGTTYNVGILQNYSQSDKETAGEKIDLKKYDTDLREILASIKVQD